MNKPLDGPTPIVGADKIDWRPAIERARKYADSAPVRCRAAVEAAFQQGYGMGRFDGARNRERIAAEAVDALKLIMHARRNPNVALTDMSRAGMRELAGEALSRIKAAGWEDSARLDGKEGSHETT